MKFKNTDSNIVSYRESDLSNCQQIPIQEDNLSQPIYLTREWYSGFISLFWDPLTAAKPQGDHSDFGDRCCWWADAQTGLVGGGVLYQQVWINLVGFPEILQKAG